MSFATKKLLAYQATIKDKSAGYMHWLTILTALFYAGILAFLVLIRGWELTNAAALMLGVGFAVMLVIFVALALMSKEVGKTFWHGLGGAFRAEVRGLLNLIRFK